MKDKQLREKVMEITGQLLKSELKKLCSDNFNSSMLHSKAEDIKSFSFHTIINEARDCAPTLSKILYSCTTTTKCRANTDAVVATIICMLAKHHRSNMCLFQKVTSLLLYAGHCSKMVRFMGIFTITLS